MVAWENIMPEAGQPSCDHEGENQEDWKSELRVLNLLTAELIDLRTATL